MADKFEKYKKKLDIYRRSIDREFKRADYIISRIGKSDSHLVNAVYDSALIRMCIKYESFTTEAYKKIIQHENIVYNRPWDYTRNIADALGINVDKEYAKANEAWHIYNSLKHVNINTTRKSKVTEDKLKLSSARDRAKYIYDSLTTLLNKLDSTKGIGQPIKQNPRPA